MESPRCDIFAWSITTGYDALSSYVTADMAILNSLGQVLERLRNIASQEFGISHVTIQMEDSEDGCVEDHHIAHLGCWIGDYRTETMEQRLTISSRRIC